MKIATEQQAEHVRSVLDNYGAKLNKLATDMRHELGNAPAQLIYEKEAQDLHYNIGFGADKARDSAKLVEEAAIRCAEGSRQLTKGMQKERDSKANAIAAREAKEDSKGDK